VLGEALKQNTVLKRCFLDANYITPSGAIVIAEALKINSKLTYLSLSGNSFKDIGCRAIIQAMKHNEALRSLSIANNTINGPVDYIYESLSLNTSLTRLNLSGIALGRAGIEGLSRVLTEKSRLRILYLSGSSGGAMNSGELIANAIKKNNSLTFLDLSANLFNEKELRCIFSSLKTNTTLLNLNIQISQGFVSPFPSEKELDIWENKYMVGFVGDREWNPLLQALNNRNRNLWKLRYWTAWRILIPARIFLLSPSFLLPPELICYILHFLNYKQILSKNEERRVVEFAAERYTLKETLPSFLCHVFGSFVRSLNKKD